jgi:hypothetical protein
MFANRSPLLLPFLLPFALACSALACAQDGPQATSSQQRLDRPEASAGQIDQAERACGVATADEETAAFDRAILEAAARGDTATAAAEAFLVEILDQAGPDITGDFSVTCAEVACLIILRGPWTFGPFVDWFIRSRPWDREFFITGLEGTPNEFHVHYARDGYSLSDLTPRCEHE